MRQLNPISDYDQYLFHEGRHFHSYRILGSHLGAYDKAEGVMFRVWAPNAEKVRVVGDFNNWSGDGHALRRLSDPGIWELFVPGIGAGALYKYEITAGDGGKKLKADPYAFWAEMRPGTASKVAWLDGYRWRDDVWPDGGQAAGGVNKPLAIYEVHLGSWRRKRDGGFYTYRELADELVDYVVDMAFTHIEIMPLAEHPFDRSWGYQATGYYAPTSRHGHPDDFKYFVDICHERGIGVILDWVPGHFCKDDHGLRLFDGTPLYESELSKLAENPGWGTLNFDYCRPEVWSFLISNALYWLDIFHVDGLRVDAVANMLYRDYGKSEEAWLPNQYGGRENLEAVDFIKKLNEVVHHYRPRALVIAEESTTWPLLTRPVYSGGLGFDYKWNMGWMNDTLKYMSTDPANRPNNHNLLTFSLLYAFSENFLLPLSHDEVVHQKNSLLAKMPGDYWQKFANLRAFYGYFMAHPGKKLLFMGGEFGQFTEWNEDRELDWMVLGFAMHANLRRYVQELNRYYRQDRALWQCDETWPGFEWIDCDDHRQSIISFIRKSGDGEFTIILCNFIPVVRHEYRIGVPQPGRYREVLNSDLSQYGGSGQHNPHLETDKVAWRNQPYSLSLTVPPLATIFIKLAVGETD